LYYAAQVFVIIMNAMNDPSNEIHPDRPLQARVKGATRFELKGSLLMLSDTRAAVRFCGWVAKV
jgi:hypothetical protein